MVTSPFGDTLNYTLNPGQTATLVDTSEPIFEVHPTKLGGVEYGFGIGVDDLSVSLLRNDDDIQKIKLTGGAWGFLRFSVYGTEELDFGACWSL